MSAFLIYIFSLFRRRIQEIDLEKELETQKNNLANLEAILSAQEKERKRIADDLHDEIGANLSLVQKNLFYLKKNETINKQFKVELNQSIELVNISIQSIRNISQELIPNQVIQLGIVKAINQHFNLLENPIFTKCEFKGNVDSELEIDQDDAIDIYRIYMELITNIIKHSNSTELVVDCNKIGDFFVLTLFHNGFGLSLNDYENWQLKSQGLGLKSLSNRVKRIGASINFEEKDNQYLIELKYQLRNKNR
jgi:signal transduction histidine kinase